MGRSAIIGAAPNEAIDPTVKLAQRSWRRPAALKSPDGEIGSQDPAAVRVHSSVQLSPVPAFDGLTAKTTRLRRAKEPQSRAVCRTALKNESRILYLSMGYALP